jgi:hypothetical protein
LVILGDIHEEDMRVEIGNESREITATEFIAACKRNGVEIQLHSYRPFCARHDAQAILEASPELEAAVLIELAKTNREIFDALKEREAILWAGNLPHSLQKTARALMGK